MTIAGSDNSGGAGIQADLKTFTSLGCYGTSAVSCVVAENPFEVRSITSMRPKCVREQMELIFEAFPVKAMKTGMLFSQGIIEEVCNCLRELPRNKRPKLVVDPVMVSTSGTRLLKEEAIRVLCEELLPMAHLVTPNLEEAAVLLGQKIVTEEEAKQAAILLSKRFDNAVLVKGGHLQKDAVDFLANKNVCESYRKPRVKKIKTHGTGCTYSAAIVSYLGKGEKIQCAVALAKDFVYRAIEGYLQVGRLKVLNQLPVK